MLKVLLSVAVEAFVLTVPPRASVHRRVLQPSFEPADLARLNPNALAYVGDSVLELYCRLEATWPPGKLVDQQKQVVDIVRAETQALVLRDLLDGTTFTLRDRELTWVKRGRNSVTRRGPLRLKASVYQDASGLECLVGYLYLTDASRCNDLLLAIHNASLANLRIPRPHRPGDVRSQAE